ncbi:restriction endonuclease [Planococcus lenghuensis]|uniref:Restriction endonuclease type IV Mrr domain-containing protein n=1 Tax=Planococcus lenghuensis TaxID=2213202 RepID=A0A1Q2L285_9BACL|nr:restriction endonuclease [Planococcus lenghuensis]AQQ54157.1 hypothetical protein B0X71_14280 [Planococcus lenghuensis]
MKELLNMILHAGKVLLELLLPSKDKEKPKNSSKPISEESKKSQMLPADVKRELDDDQIIDADLSELTGGEFERLIAMYYKEKGYHSQIVDGFGDQKVDVILTNPKDNMRIAVQCKHWKTKKVGNDTILRLNAGKRIHKCLDAWCITTSGYTKSAIEAAEGLNVELLDGHHVQDFIENWQKRKRTQIHKQKKAVGIAGDRQIQ